MSSKKYSIVTWGLTLVALTGCGSDGGQAGGGFQRPPTPVETSPVELGPMIDRFTTVGTLEAHNSVTVTGEIDGIIVEVPFKEGRPLVAGELIARLDDDQLQAEAQRARALRDKTRATWERVKTIVDQGAGAPQDLDDATADLKVAEANLALAETRRNKTRITAPFSGLSGKRLVSPGTFMRAGTPITQLAQIDKLRVAFAVPERILGSMHLGAEVSVSTPAFPDVQLKGLVDVIEPEVDTTTRTIGILAVVDNTGEILRPGMSATIAVILEERAEALTVPTAAIFVEGGQAYVYVVKPDSIVTRATVTLGTRLTDVVEVLEGVDLGQQVVRAGHQKLYEGAKVAPVVEAAQETGGEGEAAR